MSEQSAQSESFAWSVPQRPQRQDSLTDQLRDLHIVAARLGLYDAADWLWKTAIDTQNGDSR